MKRIQLFELEDQNWFPVTLRNCMRHYLNAFHKLLNTPQEIADLVTPLLEKQEEKVIYDQCSGSGGPMPWVLEIIRKKEGFGDSRLVLSDYFPDERAIKRINSGNGEIYYDPESRDATDPKGSGNGVRTLICSMHHFRPSKVKDILSASAESGNPILTFEISDNSFPKWMWWVGIPFTALIVLFVTPFVRPFTFPQFFFTYLLPILPLAIAWDGAVSNARTYTLEDLDIVISEIEVDDYIWEKGKVKGKGGNRLYLIGRKK